MLPFIKVCRKDAGNWWDVILLYWSPFHSKISHFLRWSEVIRCLLGTRRTLRVEYSWCECSCPHLSLSGDPSRLQAWGSHSGCRTSGRAVAARSQHPADASGILRTHRPKSECPNVADGHPASSVTSSHSLSLSLGCSRGLEIPRVLLSCLLLLFPFP